MWLSGDRWRWCNEGAARRDYTDHKGAGGKSG